MRRPIPDWNDFFGEVFRASGGTIGRWSHLQEQGALFKSGVDGSGLWTLDELDALVGYGTDVASSIR